MTPNRWWWIAELLIAVAVLVALWGALKYYGGA
jgi:hypothetical protein